LFSKLEEEIYESLSNLRNNIEDIYSEINNTQRKNKENFLINLVTIQSLNNISFETLSSSYMNLNESGFYNYLQKISTE
jgi:chloramphenicol O-acetyltransferase